MNKKIKHIMPIYMQIAIDLAAKISRKELQKGIKIRGRSELASEYNVSPETIRKAISLLNDMKIVEVKHGNGIFVLSYDNAKLFIDRYEAKSSVNELKEKLTNLMGRRTELEKEMNDTLQLIIDYSSRFKHSGEFTTYEIIVPDDCVLCGKSIGEARIWQNTGATIVAIKRNERMLVSPGPFEMFEIGDILMYVGDQNCCIRLKDFLEGKIASI